MTPLVECPGCARHIRAHESQCPFCATVTRARPPSHASAAASALLVAAMGVASAGCSVMCEAVSVPGVCAERNRPNINGPISRNHAAPEPVYGGPPVMVAAAYGAAPPPEPVVTADAGVAPIPEPPPQIHASPYHRERTPRYGGPRFRNGNGSGDPSPF
ncbi:MAG: hypothetical protein JNK05_10780 [Myxococcales bacterium]|nr:hypothetical protein [Myxococcales bacterium]